MSHFPLFCLSLHHRHLSLSLWAGFDYIWYQKLLTKRESKMIFPVTPENSAATLLENINIHKNILNND
jgi:hypothetical protein